MARRRRLIVVANRLPVQRTSGGWDESPGGLVTAMMPVVRSLRGAWVGWVGGVGRVVRPFLHEGVSIRPVSLQARHVEGFYHGFSNRTIWPLFHDAIRTPEFERAWWPVYVDANLRFARAAARRVKPGDIVWVHDYQLLLAPAMIRAMCPGARIGFFLHIPFPPEELFAWLPWRREVLEGLLGADVVGFQTPSGMRNFSRAAREWTEADGTDSALVYRGREIAVGSFPISIDTGWFERRAALPEVRSAAAEIRRRLGAKRRMILSVDRLDYTKGIERRLQSFAQVLARGEWSADRCVLVQIAVPSRETVAEYVETRSRVEQIVGRINGDFSEPGRVAVHYFRRSLSREELVAFYVAADVMLVTPLRDGMNLVAKEYVATRLDSSGALVLSEFAGAANEMRRALLVNPYDIDGAAATLERALTMPTEDRKRRMSILRMTVRRHDVHVWAEEFMKALAA